MSTDKAVKKKAIKKKIVKKTVRRTEIKDIFDPNAQAKAEREFTKGFAALDEEIDERYAYAKAVIEAQSSDMQQAIDTLVEKMGRMAGEPAFYYKRIRVNAKVDREVAEKMQAKNHYYIAVRLFVACAKWDIQIGDFKFPKNQCAMCGEKV